MKLPAHFKFTIRLAICVAPLILGQSASGASSSKSRFSDEPAPMDTEGYPDRPKLLIEWGDDFLGTGNLQKGIRLPTGAVWSPNFWVFGEFRSALQTFDPGNNPRRTEWANRLDLFANLELSPTERVLVGFRPLDRNGRFTGYTFEPASGRGGDEDFTENSLVPRTFFFEGEFGEIFPLIDASDSANYDYGFSIGRQPFSLQDGLLINDDALDMIGITRNALLPRGGAHYRITGFFAANEVDRNNNSPDNDALVFGLSTFFDYPKSTIEADAIYVNSGDANGFYAGIGGIQRIGKISTTFRINQSVALDDESPQVATGTLLFSEASYSPAYTHDNIYANAFLGIDNFSSAVRGPVAGGPLGRIGILFAAVGLGNYGAPLSNRPNRAVGGAVGYQKFFGDLRRRQIVFEAGAFQPTNERDTAAQGLGVRFQQAFGKHSILVLDVFGALRQESRESFGGRAELRVKF
ncbi:MAG: hypothetical protein CMO80_25065 [Verrucomicrobiales bacterium]|nr:hypothetical protein [Verrucomicrobiales bacterium]|tara:strand:- start:6557 stop:7951 length:1395 start_codon:yes stop_codon:yes gene_type:complete